MTSRVVRRPVGKVVGITYLYDLGHEKPFSLSNLLSYDLLFNLHDLCSQPRIHSYGGCQGLKGRFGGPRI